MWPFFLAYYYYQYLPLWQPICAKDGRNRCLWGESLGIGFHLGNIGLDTWLGLCEFSGPSESFLKPLFSRTRIHTARGWGGAVAFRDTGSKAPSESELVFGCSRNCLSVKTSCLDPWGYLCVSEMAQIWVTNGFLFFFHSMWRWKRYRLCWCSRTEPTLFMTVSESCAHMGQRPPPVTQFFLPVALPS